MVKCLFHIEMIYSHVTMFDLYYGPSQKVLTGYTGIVRIVTKDTQVHQCDLNDDKRLGDGNFCRS